MSNRKKATEEAARLLDKILPGGGNGQLITEQLNRLSDEEFDAYMAQLESGEEILPLVAPNLKAVKLTIENNLALAEELGHEFFERLWLTDPKTGQVFLTNIKYLVIDLPLRRQQQLLVNKIKIPGSNRHVDSMTGQATGPSKGSSLSFPEMQVMASQSLERTIEEFMKFRGGDTKAFQAMSRDIVETGGVSQDSIKRTPTSVKATETLSVLLKSMHLDNNL